MNVLPFYSLTLIVFGVLRIAYGFQHIYVFLILSAFIDAILVLLSLKRRINKVLIIVLIFLIISLIVGAVNGNEVTRRYITDLTNPLFFFGKVFLFQKYWEYNSFRKFVLRYTKVAIWGSLFLLPVTYYLFNSVGATRMSIFPPLELPLAAFINSKIVIIGISLALIVFYGKRAQLVGGVLTIVLTLIFTMRKSVGATMRFFQFGFFFIFLFLVVQNVYSDNLAVRRLIYTLEQFQHGTAEDIITNVSGSRLVELDAAMANMNGFTDYVFGKGLGYTYIVSFGSNTISEHANAHFTPVALLTKYGLIFTLFFYGFTFRILYRTNLKSRSLEITAAFGSGLFIIIESFFAYSIFLTPLFPVMIGYLLKENKIRVR